MLNNISINFKYISFCSVNCAEDQFNLWYYFSFSFYDCISSLTVIGAQIIELKNEFKTYIEILLGTKIFF